MELLVKTYLGSFGRYQAFIYALVFVGPFLAGSQSLVFSWTGYSANVRCRIPALDDNLASNGYLLSSVEMDQWYPKSTKEAGNRAYCSYCPNTTARLFRRTCHQNETVPCDHGFVFDTSVMKTTLASQFDLHCDSLWRKDMSRIVYNCGNLFGAILFGILADKYGRRPVFLGCAWAQILVFNSAVFATNFYVFLVYQFTIGALQDGTYIAGFVVFCELVSGWARTVCGVWYQGFFTLGELWVGAAAYATRRRVPVQVAAGIVALLFLPYYWLFPESLRWLVVVGRTKEAKRTLDRATRFNKTPTVPKQTFDKAVLDTVSGQVTTGSIFDLFRKRSLAKNTLIIFFSWYAVSLCYYGLSYNTSELGSNPFLSYMLLTLFELPGFFICIPIMEYVGRKPALVSLLGVGGLCCIGAGLSNTGWVTLTLALVGKMCVSAAFAVLYNVSTEVFPTVVRNIGTGMGSFSARLGSISAPLVHLLLKPLGTWVPFFVYGLLPFVAALLDFLLPETRNKPSPETIEDAA